MEEPKAGTSHHRNKRHRKSQHSGKPNPYRRIEAVISKHLLKILGFIFILVVAGYSVSSLDKLRVVAKQLYSQEKVIQQTAQAPFASQAGRISPSTGPSVSFHQEDVKMMIILCSLITLFFTAMLFLSIRIHRKEIPRIAVIVFYTLAFIIARKYGWQIHVLFPMMFVFSAVLFYSGIRLHSMLAGKWNYLAGWGFFMTWWAMKMLLGGQAGLLWGFFLYGFLFYLLFLYMGVQGGFKGHHKFSDYAETGLIILNIVVFYLMGMASLGKFRHMEYAWIFSLLISFVNFGTLLFADHEGKKLKRGPYVFPTMVILSLIFPFIFQASAMILFMAILSCLLLFYSKYSGDRIAVLTALFSVVIMLLVYFKDWVFLYLPAAFLGNVLDSPSIMMKGLVAGLVIFPVMLINSRLVRKLHVDFSKEWFSRSNYQRFFKGVNLIVLYLSAYWIVNYFILVWSKNPDLNYMSWFGYNCLFFIIAIPMLSAQKSKFISPAIGFALFFSLAYPTLIHFTTLDLRNDALQHEHISRLAFWFHYPVVVLFITEIILLEIFLRRTFEKNPFLIRFFTAMLLLMGLFILLSEYDHFSIWTGLRRGITIEEIALANRVIPYTIILLAYSVMILGIGMVSRNRLLRASGLVFLLGTLVKMLYIDVRALTGITRSVMLFTVGFIVLTLSFMYPRLKRYFRQREHEAKGINKRHRHHSHQKPVSIPDDHVNSSADETL
ncbi:MAG: DUF2339 domain-containing protein [Bacteroidetes bacterium]|nr:DUF2339 domain-containing protein [Bacteroidota bacterium]